MAEWRPTLPRALQPKRRRWFAGFLAIAFVTVGVFLVLDIWRGWSPGDVWGLTFGTLAATVVLLEVLYALRRRLMRWRPLNTAQAWLQVHVYGGALAMLFVLIHAGFSWPHGNFGWLLLLLTVSTTLSGLLGVFVQKRIPMSLTHALGVEAIYEKIPEMVADLRTDAAQVVTGASDVLQRFYGSRIQPSLAGPQISWSYLFDARSGRDRQLADFEGIRSFLAGEDRDRVERLQTLVVRKMELEAHYTLQTVLRLWPLVHVPVAMLLIAAIVAHVAAVWRY